VEIRLFIPKKSKKNPVNFLPLLPFFVMDNVLHMNKLSPGTTCPVMVTKIPKQIQKEIDGWITESRRYKDSPLAELRAHENTGYLSMDGKAHNSYQCSISQI